MGKKSVRTFILLLILILLSGPVLADTYYVHDRNETAEKTTGWSEVMVYGDHCNESYFQPGNLSSGSINGTENSTLNASTQLDDRVITTFPIDDVNHIVAVGLCATLLIIFGIIIVNN